jgi:glycosyltransferase involved in cell wall biosynthesis
LRLVSRLIVGGPAHNVCLLTAKADRRKFTTWLAYGHSADGERTNVELAHEMGIEPICIGALQRRPGPKDLRALLSIRELVRDIRPHLVHTHTAKAGGIGRVAGFLNGIGGGRPRPRLVHTFHGHVFDGYFGPWASRAIVLAERGLARLSDAIVVVSESVKREITEKYQVAPEAKVHVIPLGFEFGWTTRLAENRGWLRARFAIPERAFVIGCIGRLTEVKNIPMALDGFRRFVRADDCGRRRDARLVIFGDGALRAALEEHSHRMGIASQVHFAGWELDRAKLYSDLDVVCLTSLNEGTPVALIEAIAAGVPVISTDVGGVCDVVVPGVDGELIPSGSAEALAAALARAPSRDGLFGCRRSAVRSRFSVERLVSDTASLYQRVLEN